MFIDQAGNKAAAAAGAAGRAPARWTPSRVPPKEAKMVRVRVKVRDECIADLKARPPHTRRRYRIPLHRCRIPPQLSDEYLKLIGPESREAVMAGCAEFASIIDEELDDLIRIFDEYNRNGVAFTVVEVEESVLEKYRKEGVFYELVDV